MSQKPVTKRWANYALAATAVLVFTIGISECSHAAPAHPNSDKSADYLAGYKDAMSVLVNCMSEEPAALAVWMKDGSKAVIACQMVKYQPANAEPSVELDDEGNLNFKQSM